MGVFARNLRLAMRKAGVSQRVLSERTGIARSTIANWVNGRTKPRALELTMAAKALGTTVEDLMYGEEW